MIPEIEPRLTMCDASTFPAVLGLWPRMLFACLLAFGPHIAVLKAYYITSGRAQETYRVPGIKPKLKASYLVYY